MDQEKVKKMLGEQLQLLAEHSRGCSNDCDLFVLTRAMIDLAEALFPSSMI